jgi:hypothetical protein
MKVVEIQSNPPAFNDLLEAAQQEDILLIRDGKPMARLQKFDAEDWEDWQYEASPGALERGRHAREQYARGEYKTLEQIKMHDGLSEATEAP